MSDTLVSRRYARALMQAAVEQNALEAVQKDVAYLQDLIEDSEDFRAFLMDPMVRPRFKQETFRLLFGDFLHPITVNFLILLAEKQREPLLQDSLVNFQQELDDAAGVITAQAITVVPLTRSQKNRLIDKLERFSRKQIRLEEETDPAIIGGIVVHLGDTVLDGSVATQLRRLEEYLAKG